MDHGSATPAGTGITRPQVLLMAVACGLVVADIYYVQPLLPDLARELRAPPATVGAAVTTTQLGYALGLVFIVPLGDLVAKRRLAVGLLLLSIVALVLTACAPSAPVLLTALGVVGVCSVAVNVLVPLAATMAADAQRGRVVGTVMTGLLLGVLLARTVSGVVDQIAGWRAVYVLAAVVVAALALLLSRALPDPPAVPGLRYGALLGSIAGLIRSEPFLRRRMLLGALGFGSFQMLWTSVPFLLAAPPYGYPVAVIGLFGLIGAAGVLCAQAAGRLQDRGLGHRATGAFVVVLGVSWLLLAGGSSLLPLLVLGILLLDIGVQGLHVINQGRIYGFPVAVRSRVTTAYMTSYFLGGAAGSGLAVALHDTLGWPGVCLAGGVLAVGALIVWSTDRTSPPAEGPAVPSARPPIDSKE